MCLYYLRFCGFTADFLFKYALPPEVCTWVSATIHHLPQLTGSLSEKKGDKGSKGSIPLIKLSSTTHDPQTVVCKLSMCHRFGLDRIVRVMHQLQTQTDSSKIKHSNMLK